MTMFMETTRISPDRTVSEIQNILSSHGANAVLLDFENKQVASISFKYSVDGLEVPFRLPCRWKMLESKLKQSGKRPRSDDTFENWARRVAWRQILRWVEAQMALTETDMVTVQEVFFPYIQCGNGKTMYEFAENKGFKGLLAAPEEKQ